MVGGRHTRSADGNSRRRVRAERNKSLWILLGGVVVLGMLISLFTIRGIHILELRRRLQSSLLSYDEAMVERQDLENQLAQKDSLATIEDAARELLGWVMPGEVRVLFVDWTDESVDEGE